MHFAIMGAWRRHGSGELSVAQELRTLSNLGIDLDAITEKLQVDGIASFASAYDRVLTALEKKRNMLVARASA